MLLAQSTILLTLGVFLAVLLLVLNVMIFMMFFSTWIQAFLSGVPLPLLELIGMKLRQTDFRAVVRALIMAKQGGVFVPWNEMEKAWTQGVDLEKVTLAMIQASKHKGDVAFRDLVDAELEGRLSEMLGRRNEAHLEEVAV